MSSIRKPPSVVSRSSNSCPRNLESNSGFFHHCIMFSGSIFTSGNPILFGLLAKLVNRVVVGVESGWKCPRPKSQTRSASSSLLILDYSVQMFICLSQLLPTPTHESSHQGLRGEVLSSLLTSQTVYILAAHLTSSLMFLVQLLVLDFGIDFLKKYVNKHAKLGDATIATSNSETINHSLTDSQG